MPEIKFERTPTPTQLPEEPHTPSSVTTTPPSASLFDSFWAGPKPGVPSPTQIPSANQPDPLADEYNKWKGAVEKYNGPFRQFKRGSLGLSEDEVNAWNKAVKDDPRNKGKLVKPFGHTQYLVERQKVALKNLNAAQVNAAQAKPGSSTTPVNEAEAGTRASVPNTALADAFKATAKEEPLYNKELELYQIRKIRTLNTQLDAIKPGSEFFNLGISQFKTKLDPSKLPPDQKKVFENRIEQLEDEHKKIGDQNRTRLQELAKPKVVTEKSIKDDETKLTSLHSEIMRRHSDNMPENSVNFTAGPDSNSPIIGSHFTITIVHRLKSEFKHDNTDLLPKLITQFNASSLELQSDIAKFGPKPKPKS